MTITRICRKRGTEIGCTLLPLTAKVWHPGAASPHRDMARVQPVEDNNTVNGREQNRRVEVAIFANDKLKKAAKRGDIPVNN